VSSQARASIFRGKNAPFQLEDNITYNPERWSEGENPELPEIPEIPDL
jgi:hypothetical protein